MSSSYSYTTQTLSSTTKLVSFYYRKLPISTKQFIILLDNTKFCDILVESLSKHGYPSYMIKTSVISNKLLDVPFTITITKTEFLSKVANYSAFEKQLASDKKHFQVFTSLSGNILIVPSPKYGEETASNWRHYHNISGFLKYAPSTKLYLFWKYVKTNLKHCLQKNHSIIIRTIGHHVPYFHLRFEII